MDIKEQDGLEISLGYSCNYDCHFCFLKKIRNEENFKKEQVLDLLFMGYENGKRFIIFTGGEPTLDKNLLSYIQAAKGIGYEKILLHTNGFRLAEPKYLHELQLGGLNGVILSIHGFGEVADKITKISGSFRHSLRALVNISKLMAADASFTLDTNTVICRINHKTLFALYRFLLKFPIKRRMFTYPYALYKFDKEELKSIYPDYAEITPEMQKILDDAYLNGIKDVVIESIPYCVMPSRYWRSIEDNYRTSKELQTITNELQEFYDDDQYYTSKIKTETCHGCKKYYNCYGIPSNYIEVYGEKEFKIIS